jgi:hypothetical protein
MMTRLVKIKIGLVRKIIRLVKLKIEFFRRMMKSFRTMIRSVRVAISTGITGSFSSSSESPWRLSRQIALPSKK